jgi:hypothetical protein
MTTHPERRPASGDGDPLDSVEPRVPRFVSGVTLILGIWLMLVPLMWSYGDAEVGFDAQWNDVLIGLAVTLIGLVCLTRPVRSVAVSMVLFVLGVWLVAAPLVIAYGLGDDSTLATVNDTIIGAAIAVLSVIAHEREMTAVSRKG